MTNRHRPLEEPDGPLLARQASEWFEQQGMLFQAIEAAFLAGNGAQTIGLIERFVASSRYKNLREYQMLSRWLKQVPLERLKLSPSLCLIYAMTLWCTSPTDQFDQETLMLLKELLGAAETGFAGQENRPALGEVLALRALTSWRQETLPRAVDVARQALELLPARELLWRSVSEQILGVEALFTGQFRRARELFEHTRASAQSLFAQTASALPAWTWGKTMFTHTATAFLAWTCFQQGELQQAATYYQQVLNEPYEPGQHSDHVYALLGLGWIAYERNELTKAAECVQEAALLGKYQPFTTYQAYTALLQARVLEDQGDAEAALRELANLQERIMERREEAGSALRLLAEPQMSLLPSLERAVLMARARIYLRRGDLARAQDWADTATRSLPGELPRFQYEQEAMFRARLSLARGAVQQALTELQTLLAETPAGEQGRNALEIQLLLSLAEFARHQEIAAGRHLLAALAQAQPQGYLRLFLNEGAILAQLLQSVAPFLQDTPEKAYLQQLLQALTSSQAHSTTPARLLEPLSPQELRVLRLLATGTSAPQIAQQLIVSVTTVRSQIQSIYRKLQVNNRVSAISTARLFQLL
jgi:LuxR family maltose regulon positive regulatory protein